jgi:hypothetical protein
VHVVVSRSQFHTEFGGHDSRAAIRWVASDTDAHNEWMAPSESSGYDTSNRGFAARKPWPCLHRSNGRQNLNPSPHQLEQLVGGFAKC